MKIIQTFSDPRNSSLSLLTEERTAALASLGNAVGLLAPAGSRLAERFARPDSGVQVLTSRFSVGSSMTVPVKLQRLLGKGSRDDMAVFHCPTISLADRALMACKAAGRGKVVLELPVGTPPPDKPLTRYVLESVDAVILPSQADADMLLGSGAWINHRRLRVVSPGVSLPHPETTAASCPLPADAAKARRPHKGPGTLTLIWSGEMRPGCGLDSLVEALGTNHHLRIDLIVAGQGPGRYVMPIIRRTRALGIDARIEWAGDTAPTPQLIDRADAGIITAPHSPVAISSAAIYMAAGIPVIWADGPLARDTVMSDVDGIICGHTSDDFADALRALIDDPDWRLQLGHDARAKAEAQFSLNRHTDALSSLYLSLTC